MFGVYMTPNGVYLLPSSGLKYELLITKAQDKPKNSHTLHIKSNRMHQRKFGRSDIHDQQHGRHVSQYNNGLLSVSDGRGRVNILLLSLHIDCKDQGVAVKDNRLNKTTSLCPYLTTGSDWPRPNCCPMPALSLSFLRAAKT